MATPRNPSFAEDFAKRAKETETKHPLSIWGGCQEQSKRTVLLGQSDYANFWPQERTPSSFIWYEQTKGKKY
jgi:hypothetical protein